MAIVIPDVALVDTLEIERASFNAGGTVMKLYANNYTPVAATVLGDFSEATFPGYASANNDPYGAAAMVGPVAQIDATEAVFTRGVGVGSEDIYGYWVEDGAGNLLYAERFAGGPYTIANVGDLIGVTVHYQLGQL